MAKLVFISAKGGRTAVDAAPGTTVLQAAWDNRIAGIEGACEGAMACSTCHVIVDTAHFALLPDPTDEEEDLLDLAWGVKPTSRLGCQIVVTEELDGMELHVPAETNNQM